MKNTLRLISNLNIHIFVHNGPGITSLSYQVDRFENHAVLEGAVLKLTLIDGDPCLSLEVTVVLKLNGVVLLDTNCFARCVEKVIVFDVNQRLIII